MPVPIIDGEGDAPRNVSMTKIITQTNLSVLDLQEEREWVMMEGWQADMVNVALVKQTTDKQIQPLYIWVHSLYTLRAIWRSAQIIYSKKWSRHCSSDVHRAEVYFSKRWWNRVKDCALTYKEAACVILDQPRLLEPWDKWEKINLYNDSQSSRWIPVWQQSQHGWFLPCREQDPTPPLSSAQTPILALDKHTNEWLHQ